MSLHPLTKLLDSHVWKEGYPAVGEVDKIITQYLTERAEWMLTNSMWTNISFKELVDQAFDLSPQEKPLPSLPPVPKSVDYKNGEFALNTYEADIKALDAINALTDCIHAIYDRLGKGE